MPEEPTYKVFIPQPPRPETAQLQKSRPEMFWSVLKEPQKTILAGYSFEPSLLVPPMHEKSRSTQVHPLKTRSMDPGQSGPGWSDQGLGCPERREHHLRRNAELEGQWGLFKEPFVLIDVMADFPPWALPSPGARYSFSNGVLSSVASGNTQGHIPDGKRKAFWVGLAQCFGSKPLLPERLQRRGAQEMGGGTARIVDPNWPKGYSIPYDVMPSI
ncbi:hypothetical protein QYF61_017213 [Mycteria americana]|uniref:Uncharacterized protein n=1 Tax=Mycteria americana TaxID=33587 RepID=A0AAN7RGZ0_MYCAM|nr:hypothetical protein QYF61_017213 [Mycteria americana]